MDKVYIVTRGEYSDYYIEAVFPTRDSAEKWCAVHWKDENEYPRIEVHALESADIFNDIKINYSLFFVYNDLRGGRPYYTIHLGTTPFKTDICRGRGEGYYAFNGISGFIPIKSGDIDEDVALKIIYDHIAKFKAEEAGL